MLARRHLSIGEGDRHLSHDNVFVHEAVVTAMTHHDVNVGVPVKGGPHQPHLGRSDLVVRVTGDDDDRIHRAPEHRR